jgi:nitrogenase molybdenum-iron protein alpha/beta subunit
MTSNPLPASTCRTAGCTLTGALSVVTQVTDAVTVVHGPGGCTHHNFSLLYATALDNGRPALPPLVSTDLHETDIVFGGEEALDRTLTRVMNGNPGAIFVLSTCIVETIGDDIEKICRAQQGCPVIVVPTAGFLGGSFQAGVNNALIALAAQACLADPGSGVNIIGEKNLEYEVEENYAEVNRLLSLLGFTVNLRFVRNSTTNEIARLGAARLNVLRDPALVPVGEYLRSRFGTPYITGFPIGLSGNSLFLAEAAKTCDIDGTAAVARERAREAELLEKFHDLAGEGIFFSPIPPDPEGRIAARDLARNVGLRFSDEGSPVPVPVIPPVGLSGAERLLHRWRRAIFA